MGMVVGVCVKGEKGIFVGVKKGISEPAKPREWGKGSLQTVEDSLLHQ